MLQKRKKGNYPKRRKSPIRHQVRQHTRKGRLVREFTRGRGNRSKISVKQVRKGYTLSKPKKSSKLELEEIDAKVIQVLKRSEKEYSSVLIGNSVFIGDPSMSHKSIAKELKGISSRKVAYSLERLRRKGLVVSKPEFYGGPRAGFRGTAGGRVVDYWRLKRR